MSTEQTRGPKWDRAIEAIGHTQDIALFWHGKAGNSSCDVDIFDFTKCDSRCSCDPECFSNPKAFCISLYSELEEVRKWIGQAATDPQTTSQLADLLNRLEEPFHWPLPNWEYDACVSAGIGDCRKRGRENFRNFARLPQARIGRLELLEFLKRFRVKKLHSTTKTIRNKLDNEDCERRDGYGIYVGDYVGDLYAALSSHSLCEKEPPNRRIMFNLRLDGLDEDQQQPGVAEFKCFAMGHPHTLNARVWQETWISVHRNRKGDTLSTPENSQVVSKGSLCKIISSPKNLQLRLCVQKGQLMRPTGTFIPSRSSTKFSESTIDMKNSSVPLSSLLDRGLFTRFSRKSRHHLACQLSKAVWKFWQQDGMQIEWSKDTIHFMMEQCRDMSRIVHSTRPFLHMTFDKEEYANGRVGGGNDDDNDSAFANVSHRSPMALALGVMLLEMELGLKIEQSQYMQIWPESHYSDKSFRLEATQAAALEILSDGSMWKDDISIHPSMKGIIDLCVTDSLNGSLWEDRDQAQSMLYTYVLRPLANLYQETWHHPEVAPIAMPGDIATSVKENGHVGGSLLGTSPNVPKVFFSSDSWFQKLDQFKTVTKLPHNMTSQPYPRVKICILDSGLEGSKFNSTMDFQDFVDTSNSSCKDSFGHGTEVFKIIRQISEDAQFFIMRVWERESANEKTADLMTKAIRCAIGWETDIIVMSCGFCRPHEPMWKAIKDANSADILVFSAASNDSNLGRVQFPASLYRYQQVFCMFSTGADAKSISPFNPSPLPNTESNNFAIFGEGIEIGGSPLNGTSYSTAVGAGLAGRIISFSRHPDINLYKSHHLKTVGGMAEIFRFMARKEGSYWCISPWHVLPEMQSEDYADDQKLDSCRQSLKQRLELQLVHVYR